MRHQTFTLNQESLKHSKNEAVAECFSRATPWLFTKDNPKSKGIVHDFNRNPERYLIGDGPLDHKDDNNLSDPKDRASLENNLLKTLEHRLSLPRSQPAPFLQQGPTVEDIFNSYTQELAKFHYEIIQTSLPSNNQEMWLIRSKSDPNIKISSHQGEIFIESEITDVKIFQPHWQMSGRKPLSIPGTLSCRYHFIPNEGFKLESLSATTNELMQACLANQANYAAIKEFHRLQKNEQNERQSYHNAKKIFKNELDIVNQRVVNFKPSFNDIISKMDDIVAKDKTKAQVLTTYYIEGAEILKDTRKFHKKNFDKSGAKLLTSLAGLLLGLTIIGVSITAAVLTCGAFSPVSVLGIKFGCGILVGAAPCAISASIAGLMSIAVSLSEFFQSKFSFSLEKEKYKLPNRRDLLFQNVDAMHDKVTNELNQRV